jgi:aspartyl-tRNA(Asn)/glutamyl-tRNA(Gln) amidotransferase subunit C
MSGISSTELEELAALARLQLNPSEIESLRSELSSILNVMELLQAVDTQGIEPLTHAVSHGSGLRPDRPEASLSAEQALSQAPRREDDCFEVPAILPRGKGGREK